MVGSCWRAKQPRVPIGGNPGGQKKVHTQWGGVARAPKSRASDQRSQNPSVRDLGNTLRRERKPKLKGAWAQRAKVKVALYDKSLEAQE